MEQPTSETDRSGIQSDLSASLAWLHSLITMSSALLRLAMAELSLAREDLGRLVMGAVLFIPLVLMTWLSLTLLAAWIVYEQTASATMGFAMFAAIHVVALVVLYMRLNTYRHSLSLPVTRAQMNAIIDEMRRSKEHP